MVTILDPIITSIFSFLYFKDSLTPVIPCRVNCCLFSIHFGNKNSLKTVISAPVSIRAQVVIFYSNTVICIYTLIGNFISLLIFL